MPLNNKCKKFTTNTVYSVLTVDSNGILLTIPCCMKKVAKAAVW